MELLVLHSAGASEEQDGLHGAGELRGADDKGTCPLRAALSPLQYLRTMVPGKYLRTREMPKKNRFEKELLETI